jgi:aspartate 1-decarboxylase
METRSFKRTAIHNLRITASRSEVPGIAEGLVLPAPILELSDIVPFEQIIVTKMGANHLMNRMNTFVMAGPPGEVEARGALAHFLKEGDLICIITRAHINDAELHSYLAGEVPLFDVGFVPHEDHRNQLARATLILERPKTREKQSSSADRLLQDARSVRSAQFSRVVLSTLCVGLKVTETSDDCLQGSAEIPGDIMDVARLVRYQSVSVYNASRGGVAETYVIPMPPGVVMTTGAMASFAPRGDVANIATYAMTKVLPRKPQILRIADNSPQRAEML